MNNVENNINLSKRVVAIQEGREDINALINEYIPYIKSTASQAINQSVDQTGEVMSVALLAFAEAIKSYDAQKGKFLAFSKWVIKRRIIDFIRKETRQTGNITYVDIYDYSNVDTFAVEDDYAIENPLAQEISTLTSQLKEYNIDFEDLVLASPKAKKTRNACAHAARYIIEDEQLYEDMVRLKQLPIKKIQINCDIPRKLLERHRKYIVTVIIIYKNDYVYLREYVAFVKGEQST